LYSLPL